MKKNPLEKALELVNGDRQNDYGHPYINFKRIAKIWSVVLDTEVTVRQVALCMMGVKMARDVNKPTDDNFDDIAGYVLAGWMADEKEKEIEKNRKVFPNKEIDIKEWCPKHGQTHIKLGPNMYLNCPACMGNKVKEMYKDSNPCGE